MKHTYCMRGTLLYCFTVDTAFVAHTISEALSIIVNFSFVFVVSFRVDKHILGLDVFYAVQIYSEVSLGLSKSLVS